MVFMFSKNTVYHTNVSNVCENRNQHSPGCFPISVTENNLVPRLLSTLPVPFRCERALVLSGHVTPAQLPYKVGVGRLIIFVSKGFQIVTALFH